MRIVAKVSNAEDYDFMIAMAKWFHGGLEPVSWWTWTLVADFERARSGE